MDSEDRKVLESVKGDEHWTPILHSLINAVLDIDRELHKPVTDKPDPPLDGTWIP